jgi:2-hydroxycyclohexanecarboxyl-CoA dehydrogenase
MSTDKLISVVTGGAQGIGAAIAHRFASRGLNVAILDRQSAEPVVEEIQRAGGEAFSVECDLTDLDSVRTAAEQVKTVGRVQCLVNNAGWSTTQWFLSQTPEDWPQLVAINFTAVLSTCHVFAPDMGKGDAIVNVSSDAALIGVAQQAIYSGAKAGVIGFSKALSVELARAGVRVNVVCPGTTRTQLVADTFTEDDIAKRTRLIPLRRLAEPDDVAKSVTFLALDGTHVTGQVLSVNGGAARVG